MALTTWLCIIIGMATAIVLVVFGILIGIILADRQVVTKDKVAKEYDKVKSGLKKAVSKPKPAHISKMDSKRVSRIRKKKLKRIPDFLIDKNGRVH